MSQREAAERARAVAAARGVELELHSQTLSDYERGKIKKIPVAVVESLAEVYRVSVGFLLTGSPDRISEKAEDYQPSASPSSSRVARLRIQARVAELTDGDEEAEERAMRIVDRAVEAFSAGGRTQPADDRAIARIISSVGAEVIADLEASARVMKRGRR